MKEAETKAEYIEPKLKESDIKITDPLGSFNK